MWDLPGPGIEPVSPALAGGFLTTAPPGKPCGQFLEGNSFQTQYKYFIEKFEFVYNLNFY